MRGYLVSALLAAGAGLNFARRRYAKKGPLNCENCEAAFDLIGRTRFECSLTERILCKECVEIYLPGIAICKDRLEQTKQKVDSLICTNAKELPGHAEFKVLGRVSSSKSYKDRNKAVQDLKYQCVRLGADALLELEIHKETSWISSNSQQIPGMSLQSTSNNYWADGTAVLLGHYSKSNRPVFPVADEILKFAELLDKGLITREEFDEQKAILLGKVDTTEKNICPQETAEEDQPPTPDTHELAQNSMAVNDENQADS